MSERILSTAELDAKIPDGPGRTPGPGPNGYDVSDPAAAEPSYVADGPPAWGDEPAIGGRPSTNGTRPRVLTAAGYHVLTWHELLTERDEPPPLLALGIPKIGLTVLAGPPKVGKTLLGCQRALEAGRATIIVEEGSLAGLSYRLRRQAEALGIAEPDLAVLHRQHIRLDDRQSVARIRAHVEERRPALLVLDPLNRLHGADENRPTQMTPIMDALAGIAYDYELAVVALHHLAKPSAERRGDIWDRFRGATSIRSGTDANLILDGTGDRVRLYGEFRDAEPLSTYLYLDRDSLTFSEAEGPKITTKIDLATLREFIGGTAQVTAAMVAARFGVTKQTARTTLEGTTGMEWLDGPRGTRYYTVGTGK